MKKLLTILAVLAVVLGLLTGCGSSGDADGNADASAEENADADAGAEENADAGEPLDLEELYNQGMEVISQMGDSAPILFPETDVNYLDNFYPGLAGVEMAQFYAGVAPVTNAPFEIILVEVADPADVQVVLDIFHARVDEASENDAYPENAQAWMNNCRITSRGNYVFLAVLMDPCEIPGEFILD